MSISTTPNPPPPNRNTLASSSAEGTIQPFRRTGATYRLTLNYRSAWFCLYTLWLRVIPVHGYLKTLLLRKMIKFKCKNKKCEREKQKEEPSHTYKENINTKCCIREG